MEAPFQVPVSSKRRLTPVKVDERGADGVVGNAGLAGGRDGGQGVERVVLAGDGNGPAADVPLAATHARTEVGVDDDARRGPASAPRSMRSAPRVVP